MLDLPRSARLAAWGAAAVAGSVPPAAATAAVERDDEPHAVRWAEDAPALPLAASSPTGRPTDLRGLLEAARACGAELFVVLPVPGDPVGLPGPAAVNTAALEAGECVLLEVAGGARRWALVPEVHEFGSAWEPGAAVAWRAHGAAARRAPDPAGLADAERELRTALVTATRALAALDVARWREDAADRIDALRGGALPPDALPPGTAPRALRTVHSAVQVLAIARLATEDDGAAITGFEASARAGLLRDVAGTARRALAVALNARSGLGG